MKCENEYETQIRYDTDTGTWQNLKKQDIGTRRHSHKNMHVFMHVLYIMRIKTHNYYKYLFFEVEIKNLII